jgi:glycosyltransferase involved in cell wall biosynthesis
MSKETPVSKGKNPIAIFINDPNKVAGTETFFQRLTPELIKIGHEINIVTPIKPTNPNLATNNNLHVYTYQTTPELTKTMKTLGENRNVLLFFHIPYIIYSSKKERPEFFQTMEQSSSPKILYFPNHKYVGKIAEFYTREKILKHFDQFISQSKAMTKEMTNILPPERIVELPNGVPIDIFHPTDPENKLKIRKKLNLPDNSTVYLFVGRYISSKNIDLLIKNWKLWLKNQTNTSDKYLLTVGYDPKSSRSLNDPEHNIKDLGELPEKEVAETMKAADFFILPSSLEGMSIALLEGLASGLIPLVPRNIEGIEMLDKDTIFINKINTCSIMKALTNSYQLDKESRKNQSIKARRSIKQGYTMEQAALKYSQAIEALIKH